MNCPCSQPDPCPVCDDECLVCGGEIPWESQLAGWEVESNNNLRGH